MKFLTLLTKQLIAPYPLVTDERERAQAKFFTALILGILGISLVYTIIAMLVTSWPSKVNFAGLVILLTIYLFSRSRYYQTAPYLFIGIFWLFVFSVITFNVSVEFSDTVFYLVIPILVAGVMLPLKSLYAVTSISVISVVIFSTIINQTHDEQLVSMPNMLNSVFIMVTAMFLLAHRTRMQNRQQVKLQQTEQRYQTIVNGVNDGVWYLDRQTGKGYFSPRYMEIIGYEPDEFSHTNHEWRKRLHPEDKERVLENTVPCANGKTDRFSVEYRLRHKDGSWKWVLDRGVNLKDENGEVYRLMGMHTDITQHKKLEQQSFELELERKRMQLLSSFITHSSHEFKTPLSIINSSAYMLTKTTDNERRGHYLNNIETQVKTINTLVSALSIMATLDSTPSLNLDKVDIAEVIEYIYATHQKNMNNNQVTGVIEKRHSSLFVYADYDYLQHAVGAIFDNAVRFTQPGGEIRVLLDRKGDDVNIIMSDDGVGIHEDDLPHIFERFYRSDKVGTTRGFGLGLSIAKRIIELHGGNVEIDSKVGEGTVCNIRLPINPNEAHQDASLMLDSL